MIEFIIIIVKHDKSSNWTKMCCLLPFEVYNTVQCSERTF